MLRRLKYHINVRIQQLLDHMILGTVVFATLGLLLTIIFALTQNHVWLGLLWLGGLLYALSYFSDLIKYDEIVRSLDKENRHKPIWLSKAYQH